MRGIKVFCAEFRMYQLELAGGEIFHKLYFPQRSPYFLSAELSFAQSHHSVFPKTRQGDKPFMCILKKTAWQERGKTMELMWEQKRGSGHFLYFPISSILSRHVDGRLQRLNRKEKVGRQKQNRGRQSHNERREGEGGKKGT